MRRNEEHQALDQLRILGGEAHSDEAAKRDPHHDVGRCGHGARHVPHDLVEVGAGVSQDRDPMMGEQTRNLPQVPSRVWSVIQTPKQGIDPEENTRGPRSGPTAKVGHPAGEQTAFHLRHPGSLRLSPEFVTKNYDSDATERGTLVPIDAPLAYLPAQTPYQQ
ncbi:MAG: hypothetical protein ACJ73N_13405 [Bryobacteraceae bacterium]